uniref:[acyl-carrier-protein] S-malonyltransferase n=2 Tax=Pseudomonas aeruginosa TaxID=287 RepID=A0A5E5R5E5_PSEAI|nr:Malonyl CoA-acyl carrier protein transacylase [Pseudomonas aeruginosa]
MSVLFAYPGQGAQRPGMLAALPDEPPVRACLEQAADCLGQAPAELESAEALRGTRAVQLCLLIAGVAASRLLETRGHRPGLVAGLSIGAYPAAVVAGALDFDDALRLVALRGELMQAAWPEGYGMSAILGLEQAQLEALILAVRREHPPLYRPTSTPSGNWWWPAAKRLWPPSPNAPVPPAPARRSAWR